MHISRLSDPLVPILLLGLVACSSPDGEVISAAQSVSLPPQGPVASIVSPPQVQLDYVLYFERDAGELQTLLHRVLAREASDLALAVNEPEAIVSTATLWVDATAGVITDWPAPDMETLRYFGQALSEAQMSRVNQSRHAVLLQFLHPAASAGDSLARADRVTLALASELEAFIDDKQARRVYSPASWQSSRFEVDGSSRINVMAHVAIHSYRDGELIRSVSVGMEKFGLPDIVMDGLSQSTGGPLAWIQNGILQRLLEGQRPGPDGGFVLDVRDIVDTQLRRRIQSEAHANATWQGRFRLLPAEREEGDADNALLSVSFEHFAGPDESARRAMAASQILGWSGEMKNIRHNDELEQVSARAKARLPELRKRFQAGLPAGARLMVKAPFAKADGGGEWMWVEVTRWQESDIGGVLHNEPFDIPELHRGQQVEVNMGDVFDYELLLADGSTEGAETNAVIERMQGETRKQGAE